MEKKACNVYLAVFLSCVLPGAGSVYSGHLLSGIAVFISATAAFPGWAAYMVCPSAKVMPLWYAPFVFGGLVYAAGILLAVFQARAANRKNGTLFSCGVKAAAGWVTLIIAGVTVLNPLVLAAVSVRLWVLTPFTADDEMAPAIYKNERLLVDRRAYKGSVKPRRGDVVVYRRPDGTKVSMHRVVGLPGESIELKEHGIFINGARVKADWCARKRYYNRGEFGKPKLPVTVPAGADYVVGDYSAGSNDSRFFGFVPERCIVGKVFKICYPFDRSGRVE